MSEKPVTFDLEQCGNYVSLKCPICGFNYVAPTDVKVIGGIGNISGIGTHIDAAGTNVYATPAIDRGVLIELTFSCEGGHAFVYEFHFHKGETHIRLKECSNSANKYVIWRD